MSLLRPIGGPSDQECVFLYQDDVNIRDLALLEENLSSVDLKPRFEIGERLKGYLLAEWLE
jgi:hypothetical protein